MGFIKNLIDGLKRSNDQQYIDTITYQSQKLDEYKKKIDEILISLEGRNKIIDNYIVLAKTKDEEMADLVSEYEALKKENSVYGLPNIPVDWTKFPYFAKTSFLYFDADQDMPVEIKTQLTPSKLTRLWTDEMYEFVINGMKKMSNKPEMEKVVKLRDMVCNTVTYQKDVSLKGESGFDNWKLPIQTFYQTKGDCEDMTNLWLTFCKIYGIPGNKVFNLTGTVPSGGHSFGGYLDDNNSMWIIECTAKSPIIKMKGSKYKCNSSLKGITNWMCAGIPKVEQFE